MTRGLLVLLLAWLGGCGGESVESPSKKSDSAPSPELAARIEKARRRFEERRPYYEEHYRRRWVAVTSDGTEYVSAGDSMQDYEEVVRRLLKEHPEGGFFAGGIGIYPTGK